jgi:hypothetical protein
MTIPSRCGARCLQTLAAPQALGDPAAAHVMREYFAEHMLRPLIAAIDGRSCEQVWSPCAGSPRRACA